MSIKICFVTTSSVSIDSFIMPTIPCLIEKGFEVSVVTNCASGFKERCNNNINIYDYKVGRGFDFLGTLKASIKFANLCRKRQFDIVVYATPNGALYGSIGAWLGRVPCRILAQWGMRYIGFEGYKRKIICAIEKVSCHLATDIRNVSAKNREIAIKDGMYTGEKCKVLGQGGTIGVDLEQYRLDNKTIFSDEIREKFNIPQSRLVYGFVGRVCRDKGVVELIYAFNEVLIKNSEAQLIIVGDIDVNSNIPKEVIDLANSNSHIIFCGHVPNDEVVKYMSAFDVLVHPTYREGFGMVLQEAAALSIPTITTDIPGASEAIVNEYTGLLAQKQDVHSLVICMERLSDKSFRERLGRNGRSRVETCFERTMMVERVCNDYLEIYKNRVK